MSIKSFSAKIFANYIRKKIDKWASNPIQVQENVFKELINQASNYQIWTRS